MNECECSKRLLCFLKGKVNKWHNKVSRYQTCNAKVLNCSVFDFTIGILTPKPRSADVAFSPIRTAPHGLYSVIHTHIHIHSVARLLAGASRFLEHSKNRMSPMKTQNRPRQPRILDSLRCLRIAGRCGRREAAEIFWSSCRLPLFSAFGFPSILWLSPFSHWSSCGSSASCWALTLPGSCWWMGTGTAKIYINE